MHIHNPLNRIKDQNGINWPLRFNPHLAIEPHTHLKRKHLSKLLEQIVILLSQQHLSAVCYRYLLHKTPIKLMKERLSTIPRLLVQWIDTGELHLSKLVSRQHSAVDQEALMIVRFIFPGGPLELLSVQESVGLSANVHAVELHVS